MDELNKSKPAKPFNPDFLTDQERQDRIVEILTRGVLRLVKKQLLAEQSKVMNTEISEDYVDEGILEEKT